MAYKTIEVVSFTKFFGNGEKRLVISDGAHKEDKCMFKNEKIERITTIEIRVNNQIQLIKFTHDR